MPALVLGSGITALGVVRAMARSGVESLVASPEPGFLRASRWYRPAPTAGPDEGDLARWLDSLPLDRAVLVPCSDIAVLEVARLPEPLRQRFPASVPPAAAVGAMVDKAAFGRLLERHRVPHPHTVEVRHADDLARVDDALLKRMFLKPRASQEFYRAFGRKALRIADREESRRLVREVLDRGLGVTLQEMVPGPANHQLCIDGFVDGDGVTRGVFARQWLRKHPEDFGESCLAVSVDPERVKEPLALARKVVGLLPFRGPFSVELKKDQDTGRWYVLELNARPWWYVDFTCRAGVDVCAMLYRDALGGPVETVEGYCAGRYVVYPELDRAARKRSGEPGAGPVDLARRLTAMQPIFSWADPGPSLHHLAGRAARRIRRGAGVPDPEVIASAPTNGRQAC